MKKLWLLPLVLIFLTNCKEVPTIEKLETKAKEEVLKELKAMYASYNKANDEFFDYYEGNFVRVTPKGKIQIGKEELKEEWNAYLSSIKSFEFIKYGDPIVINGQDQVITINTYEEWFITSEDTAVAEGVFTAAWKKQSDNTWKISMETWTVGLD